MGSEKKTLLFMYVDNFFGIEHESFNFDIKRRFRINRATNTIYSCPEEIKYVSETFFGEKISALTLLIGDNGAGKTTLMQLMVKWLCELYSGTYPQECGAFVIRVGNHTKLISFHGGRPWSLSIAKKTDLEPVILEEMQSILKDISLVYYTDTMTDLELEEILTKDQREYLTDYSLITRLSEALSRPNYLVDAKDTIKRAEFAYQLSLFLNLKDVSKFPIHFIKFSSNKIGSSECLEHLQLLCNDGTDMILALKEYGKSFAPRDNSPRMIPRCLLWGLFVGVVSSTLLWERWLFGTQKSRFILFFRDAFSRYIAIMFQNDSDASSEVYSMLKDLLKNLCGFVFTISENLLKNEFNLLWKIELVEKLNKYIDFLKETEELYASHKMDFNWEKRSADDRIIYYTHLNTWRQDQWEEFFRLYTELYYLMPDCRFDWHYASSGEKNLINFKLPLYSVIDKDSTKNNLWFLLDEPDNTLHPGWTRTLIQDLYRDIQDQDVCEGRNESNTSYNNYQFWISTHSPIMLSDVPKQAAIFLSTGNESDERNRNKKNQKKQVQLARSPFAQQIYTLFNDAFLMKNEVIGAFAEEKIHSVYETLSALEASLISGQEFNIQVAEKQLENARSILDCVDEPLLKGHILLIYKQCRLELNKRK